ncbi:hypothetical protein BaRGS_00002997, partial [Batillaria attramentaria]
MTHRLGLLEILRLREMRFIFLLALLCRFAFAQPDPDFYRHKDGNVKVVIPGFPGVQAVTLTVSGQDKDLFSITAHVSENPEPKALLPVSRRHLERRATTVFFDDFSSGQIDPNKWSYTIYSARHHNNEFQLYSPDPSNSYVKNGVLYIRPTLTVDRYGSNFLTNGHLDLRAQFGHCNSSSSVLCDLRGYENIPPVMAARLNSKGHIRYGKVEVVAKLPIGDWLWPAIWMMPTENHYGGWPKSGEIDIMESRGNLHYHNSHGTSMGVDVDAATFHYGLSSQHKNTLHGSNFGEAFHTYWLDWTEHYIKIGVDSHTVLAFNTPSDSYWQNGHFSGTNIWASGGKDAPFDRPFYLILNVAVGGNYFSSHNINEPYRQPWHDRWHNSSVEFWEARHLWEPTWHGEGAAMKIKSRENKVSEDRHGGRKEVYRGQNQHMMVLPPSRRHLERRATTVLFDDFSSGRIDPNKWKHFVGANRFYQNGQFQMSTPDRVNSYVKDGVLYIRPRCPLFIDNPCDVQQSTIGQYHTLTVDSFGENFLSTGHLDIAATWGTCSTTRWCDLHGYNHIPPIMSAFLTSTAHIRYGKVEVVAKLPKGDWLHPAIWMMPTEDHYGTWPRSGEIDIMEARGNLHYHNPHGGSLGNDVTFAHLNYGPRPKDDKSRFEWCIGVDNHHFAVWNTPANGYWQQGHFTGDNVWADGGKNAPFDRPFYLILTISVGGPNWFSSRNTNMPYAQPWHDNWHNSSMEFWFARHRWEPTWRGEEAAMKIKSVHVPSLSRQWRTVMRPVFLLLVWILILVNGQQEPKVFRDGNGHLSVSIQGFPGVQRVTLIIAGQEKEHIEVIDDTSDSTRSLSPVSRRHLERRATTVFFDDFSSGHIDPQKWKHSITGSRFLQNHEFQLYSPEPANSYVKNGMLYIRPTLTEDHFGRNFLYNGHLNVTEIWGECTSAARWCYLHGYNGIPPTMSAMLLSKGHIRYGRVEVVAKLPKGDWLWPAIWMMPTENHYGSWPRSGEIDIMEAR